MRKILSVVGTRPNLMKTAPVLAALERRGIDQLLVHTGQHYDAAMSQVFFDELGIRPPDHVLDIGSGTHAQQTGRVMERLEPVLQAEQPELVLVAGDVNSTMAAALVAAKLDIPVGHIEAGLRSFDRTMAEELNRVVTDALAEVLLIHSPEAKDNLLREGRPEESIHYVGNTMIDTLVAMRGRFVPTEHENHVVVTLHRPALVDGPLLREVMAQLARLAEQMTVLFPVHPRTRARIAAERIDSGAVELIEPVGYFEFMGLVASAAGVLTDSGGIQEETTYLGVPCFTLRDNTERPITIEMGTNVLLGLRPERVEELPSLIEDARSREASVPPYWDGSAAERAADVLVSHEPIRRRS